ncbi:MAG: dockerin type I repeat-containing protein [Candidatus Peribacteraceae bacterium]|nr:dockerin type I repeat-containing protein [Candidatus Peribacteraceae bacterium]
MHFFIYRPRQLLRALLFGGLCLAASFAVGIQTAGEVQPIALIEAGSPVSTGDMDGNGIVTGQDAIVILEIVRGYRTATPEQLLSDPNGDGALTSDDALRILRTAP